MATFDIKKIKRDGCELTFDYRKKKDSHLSTHTSKFCEMARKEFYDAFDPLAIGFCHGLKLAFVDLAVWMRFVPERVCCYRLRLHHSGDDLEGYAQVTALLPGVYAGRGKDCGILGRRYVASLDETARGGTTVPCGAAGAGQLVRRSCNSARDRRCRRHVGRAA